MYLYRAKNKNKGIKKMGVIPVAVQRGQSRGGCGGDPVGVAVDVLYLCGGQLGGQRVQRV